MSLSRSPTTTTRVCGQARPNARPWSKPRNQRRLSFSRSASGSTSGRAHVSRADPQRPPTLAERLPRARTDPARCSYVPEADPIPACSPSTRCSSASSYPAPAVPPGPAGSARAVRLRMSSPPTRLLCRKRYAACCSARLALQTRPQAISVGRSERPNSLRPQRDASSAASAGKDPGARDGGRRNVSAQAVQAPQPHPLRLDRPAAPGGRPAVMVPPWSPAARLHAAESGVPHFPVRCQTTHRTPRARPSAEPLPTCPMCRPACGRPTQVRSRGPNRCRHEAPHPQDPLPAPADTSDDSPAPATGRAAAVQPPTSSRTTASCHTVNTSRPVHARPASGGPARHSHAERLASRRILPPGLRFTIRGHAQPPRSLASTVSGSPIRRASGTPCLCQL